MKCCWSLSALKRSEKDDELGESSEKERVSLLSLGFSSSRLSKALDAFDALERERLNTNAFRRHWVTE
jgi:hypothetical protein